MLFLGLWACGSGSWVPLPSAAAPENFALNKAPPLRCSSQDFGPEGGYPPEQLLPEGGGGVPPFGKHGDMILEPSCIPQESARLLYIYMASVRNVQEPLLQ